MEVGTDERIARLSAHLDAARRLRWGMDEYPEARATLRRCERLIRARAATLASEICGKTATPGTGVNPAAAFPFTA
jgi:hypothetical protein